MFREITLIQGKKPVDDRGSLSFVNDLDLREFKRFYIVENHKQGFVRAWHGHKEEAKAVFVTQGAALIAAVKIDNWDSPSKSQPVEKFILSDNSPACLIIPPGYANGFMTLTSGAQVLFFSTSSVQESSSDDFRFDFDYWNAWTVEQR